MKTATRIGNLKKEENESTQKAPHVFFDLEKHKKYFKKIENMFLQENYTRELITVQVKKVLALCVIKQLPLISQFPSLLKNSFCCLILITHLILLVFYCLQQNFSLLLYISPAPTNINNKFILLSEKNDQMQCFFLSRGFSLDCKNSKT